KCDGKIRVERIFELPDRHLIERGLVEPERGAVGDEALLLGLLIDPVHPAGLAKEDLAFARLSLIEADEEGLLHESRVDRLDALIALLDSGKNVRQLGGLERLAAGELGLRGGGQRGRLRKREREDQGRCASYQRHNYR